MSSIDTPDSPETLLKRADKIQTRFIAGTILSVFTLMFFVIGAGASCFSYIADKVGKKDLADGLHVFSLGTYIVAVVAAVIIVTFMGVVIAKILFWQKSLMSMNMKLEKDTVSLRSWLQNTYGVEVSEDESKVLITGGSVHTFMGELTVIGQDSSFLASFDNEIR